MFVPAEEYNFILERVPVLCVDLLIIYEKKCLLLKRDNEPAKGQYWFPGGRIYKYELIKDAAVRKAKEETNLECEFVKIISVEETIFKNIKKRNVAHTVNICCRLSVREISNLKLDYFHIDFKWIDRIIENLHPAVKQPLELLGFKP